MPSVRLTHRTAEAVEAILSRKEPDMATETQTQIPGIPTRKEVLKDDWQQVEALRAEAATKLETATKGAGSSRQETQDCAAVLAGVAKAMLEGARKMEKILDPPAKD